MSDPDSPPPCVVVGIDGSRSAVQAALWGVAEAVDRDVPLRLVYAIDSATADPDVATRELATAEIAVRHAFTAVESTAKPVKIEVEIVQRRPTRALLDASRSAAMICVGSAGLKHATRGRIGSTASALAASAHCPVAVVRANTGAMPREPGSIVAVVDGSPNRSTALERGLEEARLRGAPLHVLSTWPHLCSDGHNVHAAAESNRWDQAQLDRLLAPWRRRYPGLDIRSVASQRSVLDYVARTGRSIQLVVMGPRRLGATDDVFGPAGHAALNDAGCAVLICDAQSRL